MNPRDLAQSAIADLKASVQAMLHEGKEGFTNAHIGRSLGLYMGHVGHQGCVSRSILELLKEEGLARQDPSTKLWFAQER